MENCDGLGRMCGGYTIVSRHLTSDGVIAYLRCSCGALRVRLRRWDRGDKVILDSGHRDRAAASGQLPPGLRG